MDALLQQLNAVLDGNAIQALSGQLGATPQQTEGAVQAALPVLLGMLASNCQSQQECQSLARAVERDHSGGVLDQVQSFFRAGNTGDGLGILGHVLGSRQAPAQQELARQTGLSGSQIGTLLALLAPVVLGALGRQAQARGGAQPDLMGSLLQGALGSLGRGQGGAAQSAGVQVLGQLLGGAQAGGTGAQNDALDGLLRQGAGLLGGLFKR